MDSLTDFVDQLSAEATTEVPPSTGFPTLGDFNDNSTGALKWKDLLVDMIYQVRSARSIYTQHGATFILSLQTADVFCYNAWACGMVTKELLQNPSMLEDKQQCYVCLSDRLDEKRARMGVYTTLTNCYSARKNIRLMLIVNINCKPFYCNIFHEGGVSRGKY